MSAVQPENSSILSRTASKVARFWDWMIDSRASVSVAQLFYKAAAWGVLFVGLMAASVVVGAAIIPASFIAALTVSTLVAVGSVLCLGMAARFGLKITDRVLGKVVANTGEKTAEQQRNVRTDQMDALLDADEPLRSIGSSAVVEEDSADDASTSPSLLCGLGLKSLLPSFFFSKPQSPEDLATSNASGPSPL